MSALTALLKTSAGRAALRDAGQVDGMPLVAVNSEELWVTVARRLDRLHETRSLLFVHYPGRSGGRQLVIAQADTVHNGEIEVVPVALSATVGMALDLAAASPVPLSFASSDDQSPVLESRTLEDLRLR